MTYAVFFCIFSFFVQEEEGEEDDIGNEDLEEDTEATRQMKLSCKFVVSLLCRCSAAWTATVGSTVGHQGSVMYVCSGRASTTEWGDSSLNALCHLDRLSWNMQHLAASCGCDLSRNFFVPLLIYLATFPLTYRVFQFLGCILEITVTWCDMSEPRWMRSLFQLTPSIGLFCCVEIDKAGETTRGFRVQASPARYKMGHAYELQIPRGRKEWETSLEIQRQFPTSVGCNLGWIEMECKDTFFPPHPNHRDGIRVRYDANPDHCHQWTAQWSWAVSYAKTSWQIDRCFWNRFWMV